MPRNYRADLQKQNTSFITSQVLKYLSSQTQYLCEWRWLEDDNGKIFRETHKNGDVVYTAHFVKYAVVLDMDGNPIDPDIKEIQK